MPRSLFDDQEPPRPPRRLTRKRRHGARRLSPSGCARAPWTRSWARRRWWGEGGFLRRAIAADRVPSLIFWGPPGTGKTTLARIIATVTSSHFVPFSAVTSGIKEVKEVMAEAVRLRKAQGRRTLLFVDEIHRFNRAQQDAFLPYVESGDVVLVGATTENPSFELNAALLSRCRVIVLEPLRPAGLAELMRRALADPERGWGRPAWRPTTRRWQSWRSSPRGTPARRSTSWSWRRPTPKARRIDAETVRRVAQRKVLLYDKSGEEHYNLISALHKSMRESDPDAAIYWFARMLASGEDPLYVARRMIRFASEDVGLADPQALAQALAAWDAYHRLGSPEGELALAQAVVYLALAPKSVALYDGYKAARRTVEERPADPVPLAIRNAPTRLMKDMGYGAGYVYAPHTEEGVGGLDCLPESLQGTRFYEPKGEGFEAKLRARLETVPGPAGRGQGKEGTPTRGAPT